MDVQPLEEPLRALLEAGDVEEATTLALLRLGPEIGGYLAALARSPDEGADVFSAFAEDLWRGLPGFRFESSLRTWAYVLARRALYRHRRDAAQRRARNLPLSVAGPASRIAAEVKEATATWQRTEVQDRVRRLRASLDPAERELLLLRIDRGLSWVEIVNVLDEDDAEPTEVKRRAAALRKRFERTKEKLKRLAEEARAGGEA